MAGVVLDRQKCDSHLWDWVGLWFVLYPVLVLNIVVHVLVIDFSDVLFERLRFDYVYRFTEHEHDAPSRAILRGRLVPPIQGEIRVKIRVKTKSEINTPLVFTVIFTLVYFANCSFTERGRVWGRDCGSAGLRDCGCDGGCGGESVTRRRLPVRVPTQTGERAAAQGVETGVGESVGQ